MKAVNSLLFGAFGLLKWLKHERQRASERLAKKVRKQGGNLGQWSRSALAIGRMLVVGKRTHDGLPRRGWTLRPMGGCSMT
ncbi:Putative replication inititation protein RepA OS=Stutzerimonas stutzeri OX=316 PE=4 SV=1 [Stutzerimonas stutzeri]